MKCILLPTEWTGLHLSVYFCLSHKLSKEGNRSQYKEGRTIPENVVPAADRSDSSDTWEKEALTAVMMADNDDAEVLVREGETAA